MKLHGEQDVINGKPKRHKAPGPNLSHSCRSYNPSLSQSQAPFSSWSGQVQLGFWLACALCVYAVVNFALFWRILSLDEGQVFLALITVAVAAISLFTLLLGVFQWSVQLTVVMAIILTISVVVNLTSLYISKASVSRADIVWMWAEADRIGDVIFVFGRRAVLPLIVGALFVSCLWWIARQMRPLMVSLCGPQRFRQVRIWATVCFGLLVASYGFVLPIGPAESNLYAFGIYAVSLTPPDTPTLSLVPDTPRYRKIVLVMDESVRADIFEERAANMLPYNSVDLGTALSTGNCSASSNAAMRWGVLQSDIGTAKDLRVHPSVWQFAKRAGFHTVLIDGQSNGKHQNFLFSNELSQIDEFVPAQSGIDTDSKIVSSLHKRLQTTRNEFIYVVMRGSHFPYNQNLPDNEQNRQLKRLEGYKESVGHVTGEFLRNLNDPVFQHQDVLLLYTSDHGQLFANGSTHCSGEYRIDEYLVPMIVVGGGAILDAVRRSRTCNVDRTDHQQLRTTALVAMGYSWSELAPLAYFPALTVCAQREMAARLRGKLPWVTAEHETLDLTIWNGDARTPTTTPP